MLTHKSLPRCSPGIVVPMAANVLIMGRARTRPFRSSTPDISGMKDEIMQNLAGNVFRGLSISEPTRRSQTRRV